MPGQQRQQKTYDHRLRDLVRETGDLTVATRRGVPRSTAAGWLRAKRQNIVTLDVLDKTESQLQAEVLKLRRRVRVLGAVIRVLLQLLRMSGFRLEAKRLAASPAELHCFAQSSTPASYCPCVQCCAWLGSRRRV
jgi:hypothetical protein